MRGQQSSFYSPATPPQMVSPEMAALFFCLQFSPGCRDRHGPAPDIVPWQLRSCLYRLSEAAALYEHADGTHDRQGISSAKAT